MLTPEQQQAQQMLLQMAQQGPPRYTGSFDVQPEILQQFFGQLSQGQLPLMDENSLAALRGLAQTGAPVDLTPMFQQQREIARQAATEAVQQVLGQMSQAGAKYSSIAAQQAAKAAGQVQAQTELGILQQAAQAQEAARARQLQALQTLAQVGQAATALGLDAARIEMAAKQFQAGMNYEDFKRQYQDVYQLLGVLWGRNVDFYLRQKPDYVAAALPILGAIVGAIIGGPAGAAAGASAGGAVSGAMGRS
jgi:hypothetical protein